MMVTYQSESIRIFTDPDHDIVFIESPDGGESLAVDTPEDCKAVILHLQELHARLVKKYMNSVALPNVELTGSGQVHRQESSDRMERG